MSKRSKRRNRHRPVVSAVILDEGLSRDLIPVATIPVYYGKTSDGIDVTGEMIDYQKFWADFSLAVGG